MSDLYDRITGETGTFERLLARLPGFSGYMDNKARRAADRMVRDHVADQVSERINRLVQIEKLLLDAGGLSYMSKTSGIKTRMQHYHDRVKAGAPGYSGFFAEIKIGPEQLESLYMFDEQQIRFADQFQSGLDALEQAVAGQSGIDEALAALDQMVVEANEAFSKRDDLITGLDASA